MTNRLSLVFLFPQYITFKSVLWDLLLHAAVPPFLAFSLLSGPAVPLCAV